MLQITIFLLFLQLFSVESQQAFSSEYSKTGDCQGEQACLYNYKTEQLFSGEDGKKTTSLSMTVDVKCHSVGKLKGTTKAKQYCMTLSDVKLQGSIFKEIRLSQQQSALAKVLEGWFCFLQNEDGKVVAVQHAKDKAEFAIGLKKSIAAAFQANFKGTEEEEEIDPQSDHISHYSYDKAPKGVQKMHRHIDNSDVIDTASGSKKKDLKITKDEDIEYRNGRLFSSAGVTDVNVKAGKKELGEEGEKSLSKALSSHGSYSLEFDHCYGLTVHAMIRQRKLLNKQMNENSMEENLKANVNETLQAQKTMLEIRETLPSIKDTLKRLHNKPSNLELYNSLKNLLQLEHEHGTLKKYTPAIKDVLNYLTKSEVEYSKSLKDVEMCEILYSLLSAEGSLRSQMVLLEALRRTIAEGGEKVISHISTITDPHIELITKLEELLDDVPLRATSLLLEFGVLASKGQPEVEKEVTRYLLNLGKRSSLTSDEFITVLMAMGNTGSDYVISTILSHTESKLEDIQLSSIRACLKFTYLPHVLDNLNKVLSTDPDEEVVVMILHTLVKGYQYAENVDINTTVIADHPILKSMAATVQKLNDTDLQIILSTFLQEVGGEAALAFMADLHYRGTDWDSSRRREYDLVAPLRIRQSDVRRYPQHKAYIYGTTVGIKQANIKAAAGLFLGYSKDLKNIKGFGKLYAECNLFSKRRTLADIQVLLEKKGFKIHGKVYAEIGGSVLLQDERHLTTRYNFRRNLYRSRYLLFRFVYSVFVYVGSVDLGIDVYLNTGGSVDASISALYSRNKLLTATAAVVPRVTFQAVGSVSLNFVVARVGLALSGSIGVSLEPRVSGKVCRYPNYQTCVGLYASKPRTSIEVYAWYQIRSLKMCRKGWFRYPCVHWGGKRRVGAVSWSWKFGGRSRYGIAEACLPRKSRCSASPLG